jgi:hypothetical protein
MRRRIVIVAAALAALVGLTAVGIAVEQATVEAWPWEYEETGRYGSIEGFEWACHDRDGRVKRLDEYTLACLAPRNYWLWDWEMVETVWSSPLADATPEYGGGGGSW